MIPIPDISLYSRHRVADDIDLEGHVVPGLTGVFYEREEDGRTATAGVYSYRGIELFQAWGYRDEAHCAWTAYRTIRGDWTKPHEGCPRIRTMPASIVLLTGEREIVLRTARRPTRGGGLQPGRAVGSQAAGCPVAPEMGMGV